MLYALKNGEALTQTELARIANIEQPTMAQLIARMERDKLVRRTPNPGDGRSSLISLTAAAAKRLPAARGVLDAGNAVALVGFTEREIETLVALLGRVVKNLDESLAEI